MEVFVLLCELGSQECNCDYFEGVFSTREKAEEYVEKMGFQYYSIECEILDKP